MKIWYLGSSDNLALLGVKTLIFVPEKSVYLSGLGVLFHNFQQELLGTGHVSPPGWWSTWPYCLDKLFLECGHVSNTCNAALTVAAQLFQLLFVPASCNRTGRGLPVVVVQRACLARSFCSTSHWAVPTSSQLGRPTSGLVGGLVKEPEACQW